MRTLQIIHANFENVALNVLSKLPSDIHSYMEIEKEYDDGKKKKEQRKKRKKQNQKCGVARKRIMKCLQRLTYFSKL